ncbi:MAG: TIM barrel protein [Clostridia bacterium]|nr:TIM barrel protein [Clostridia bacterium]
MYYSVCVPAVFSGMPLPEALKHIREAGYDYYEFWGWWDQDIALLCHAQREQCLKPAAMCTRFIPLNDPALRGAYLEGLRESIEVSIQIGCERLITQVGQEMIGVPREEQHKSIVEGLRSCAPLLEASGRTLLVEPLNTKIDHPGYYLRQSEEAFRMADEVDCARVQVLYDVYHQHIMQEDTVHEIGTNIAKIGHIHIAGHPGRHEPHHENEIDFGAAMGALARAGYTGAVGLEYFPLNNPVEGLRALKECFPLG